ncbi:YesN/AraC family two-component response regulator [Evansella vedderi]|uniref:YesN/AraC family two-component response regulator n=1 Tax=Evansella vedderi TaxID=38282 RepID=A0ABT9ZX21_9BACI|nr:helix-turn-helix domain-containing protein [Evansella vedderi]MDQ0255783.1 YesN/AraC family two-component response regulator [Evansella vedderi]
MGKILIADRDNTERIGIRWFIESYHLPFKTIFDAKNMEEFLSIVEKEKPEVVYLELEMIPKQQLEKVIQLMRMYVQKVICITTEPVFERALQAIELEAISLFVKPVSPDTLKPVFYRAAKESQSKEKSFPMISKINEFSYHSLFIKQPLEKECPSFALLKSENTFYNKSLYYWLQEYYFPFPVTCFALSNMIACILEVPKEHEVSVLQEEFQRITERWQTQRQGRLSIAIHPSTIPASSLHEIYLRSKETLKMEFFKGNQQLHWVDEKPPFIQVDPFLNPEEQRLWVSKMEERDKESIKKWLYHTFTQFPKGYPNPDLMRIKLTSILAQLRRFMYTYKLHKEEEVERKYHDVFQTIIYEPVLFSIVQEVLLFAIELVDYAEEQQSKHVFDVVERGLQYIENNFRRHDISLEDVAHAVDRSAGYFSTILSRKKGKTFRQVLNEYRMKHSKKLLLESSMTIQEIAHQIGYKDANYFSRLFKEMEGVTPRVYRRQKTGII